MPEEDKTVEPKKWQAKLVISDAANLDEEEKLAMAEWLRQHATDLLAQGSEYAEEFTGYFNPEDEDEEDDE